MAIAKWTTFLVPVLCLMATNGTSDLKDTDFIDILLQSSFEIFQSRHREVSQSSICEKSRYRAIDGRCNNLQNPTWGTPNTPLTSYLKNKYADGIRSWPRSVHGHELPNPRVISLALFEDRLILDLKYNLNTMQWGQFLAHDMALSSPTGDFACCRNHQIIPGTTTNPTCAVVMTPSHDPSHPPGSCLNIIRSPTTRDISSSFDHNAPIEQISAVTAYMDICILYGCKQTEADQLRAFVGGRLKIVERQGQHWPLPASNITTACGRYLAGDIRVNQNTELTLIHIIWLREHNNKANALALLNPGWNDEKIYQEARRINIAQFQHINYYEYLPILLGFNNMVKKGLIYPLAKGYVDDYDPSVNPGVLKEHTSAAFRYFHSLVRGWLEIMSEDRRHLRSLRLSDWYDKPCILETGDYFNALLRGLTAQPMSASNPYCDSEITQYFFRGDKIFGSDLRTIDIQRGRDHGVGSYVSARAACGLPVPKTFKDMLDYIPEKIVKKLAELYVDPEDVDLTVGGSVEYIVPGTQVGPTFLCIMLEQFRRTRVADRFFYESSANGNNSFTPSQLQAIRKGASVARIMCDNSGVTHMQPKAFLQINRNNPLVRCQDLPSIDLSHWKE